MSPSLKPFAWLTAALMFIVVLMGAFVTTTQSGDGCGASWPLCKGTMMPDWDYAAIVEFSHRLVAGLAGFCTLVLTVWIWRALPQRRPLFRLALLGLIFVALQGGLGAAAVLWPQPDFVLALHFGISLLCFTWVLLVAVLLGRPDPAPAQPAPPAPLTRWVWFVAGYTYLVMYLGAYVRHLDATLACTGWPLCNGQVWPTLYGPVGANFAHRLGAALAAVVVLRLWLLARGQDERPDLRKAANLAFALMLAQVASGALFPLGYYNLLTQMVHTGLIAAFWGAVSYLCLQVIPAPAERAGARPA